MLSVTGTYVASAAKVADTISDFNTSAIIILALISIINTTPATLLNNLKKGEVSQVH